MGVERIVEILSALVAFDTTSRNSNRPLVDWIEAYLSPLGFSRESLPDASGEKVNLFATIGPVDVRATSFPATPTSSPSTGRPGAAIRSACGGRTAASSAAAPAT